MYSPLNSDTYSNDQNPSVLKFRINPRPQKQANERKKSSKAERQQMLLSGPIPLICLKLANSVLMPEACYFPLPSYLISAKPCPNNWLQNTKQAIVLSCELVKYLGLFKCHAKMSLNIWATAGRNRNFAFRDRNTLLRPIPHSRKAWMPSRQINAKQRVVAMG